MKKRSFIALIAGVFGGLLMALGLCLCLLPEWNAFTQGVIIGCAGLLEALITLFAWRKKEKKMAVHVSWKAVGITAYGIAAFLILGTGMCFIMVWSQLILGIAIGIAGILMLTGMLPMMFGFKKE